MPAPSVQKNWSFRDTRGAIAFLVGTIGAYLLFMVDSTPYKVLGLLLILSEGLFWGPGLPDIIRRERRRIAADGREPKHGEGDGVVEQADEPDSAQRKQG
jgi:hypothetical protein